MSKHLKVTMCVNIGIGSFEFVIRIWNIVSVRKLWNRRGILASYGSFWATDWWQNSNSHHCVRSTYSRYLTSSLHITFHVNDQLMFLMFSNSVYRGCHRLAICRNICFSWEGWRNFLAQLVYWYERWYIHHSSSMCCFIRKQMDWKQVDRYKCSVE